MAPRELDRQRHLQRFLPVGVIAVLLAGCGPSTEASRVPASAPSTGAAPSSQPAASFAPSVEPSVAPTSSTAALARLPLGRVVFDRLSGGTEGTDLGTDVLDANGVDTKLDLPVENAVAVWSPSGRALLIDSYSDATGSAVGTYDLASGAYAELHPEGMAGQLDCTDWTPDERSVICGRGGPDPATDGIYAVDVRTGSVKRLTQSPYHHATGAAGECGGGEDRAVFSGDGKRFAYEQQKCGTGANPSDDEQGDIVVANADGSGARIVAPLGDVRTHPGGELSWSPTSDEIAFGTQDGKLSIVHADGSGERQIPQPRDTFAYGPTWSPDGKWILVTLASNVTTRQDLYVVSPDGATQLQLTDSDVVEAFTDWGPSAP